MKHIDLFCKLPNNRLNFGLRIYSGGFISHQWWPIVSTWPLGMLYANKSQTTQTLFHRNDICMQLTPNGILRLPDTIPITKSRADPLCLWGRSKMVTSKRSLIMHDKLSGLRKSLCYLLLNRMNHAICEASPIGSLWSMICSIRLNITFVQKSCISSHMRTQTRIRYLEFRLCTR